MVRSSSWMVLVAGCLAALSAPGRPASAQARPSSAQARSPAAKAQPASAQDQASAIQLDLQIYNSVLAAMKFPLANARILIADTTLNTGCGDKSGNPVLLNGCGMFGPPATVAQSEENASIAMPEMSKLTWQNFTAQNAASEPLKDAFQTAWPHRMSSVDTPQTDGWDTPDGTVYFSRAGFDRQRKQALVYVLFISNMKDVPTSANFYLFAPDAHGAWKQIGNFTQMEGN